MRLPPVRKVIALREAGFPLRPLLASALALALLTPSSVLAVDRPDTAPAVPGTSEMEAVATGELRPPVVELPPLEATLAGIIEHAESMPAETWDLEWLADALLLEGPVATFEWVRDHIRYEPYQGVLRGAAGTLAARAGNSFDQALLLAALLERQLVDAEFATGRLDDSAVERLLEATRVGPPSPLDESHPGEHYDVEGIGQRARRDYAVLHPLLEAEGVLTGGADVAEAASDARDHAWLRIPYGTTTLDLDPTLPDHRPGDRLTDPASTSLELPADRFHVVRLQVILEELQGERLRERVVLDERLDAVSASDDRLFLLFEPDLSGFAGAIELVLTGEERWTPVLLRNGERRLGRPFSAGGRGTDLLGDETDLPEPVSARLVTSIERPDGSTRESSHQLFDRRVDPLAQELTAVEALRPLRLVSGAPDILLSLTTIGVSTGGSDPRALAYEQAQVIDFIAQVLLDEEAARSYALADRLWPYAVAVEAMIATSEQVLVPAAGGDGHGFVAEPRLYLNTIAANPDDPADWIDVTDLAIDGLRVIPAVAGTPTAPAHLWYGTLQSALETERNLRALAAAGLEAESASASLATAPGRSRVVPLAEVPADADPALFADVRAGRIIVAGEEAGDARAWWAVDPQTGDARAMLAPGYRGYRDVVGLTTGQAVFDIGSNYAHRRAAGSRRAIRDLYGPNNPGRGKGYVPKNYAPPKRPGLPPNSRFRPPSVPKAPAPQPRCGGNEYMTIIGCVSLPAAVPLAILTIMEGVMIEMITYKLLTG